MTTPNNEALEAIFNEIIDGDTNFFRSEGPFAAMARRGLAALRSTPSPAVEREALAERAVPESGVHVTKIAPFPIQTSFEEVNCLKTECDWPECDCPRKDDAPKGTFSCPVCGKAEPHHHSEVEMKLRKEAKRIYYADVDHHPVYRRIFINGGLYALSQPATAKAEVFDEKFKSWWRSRSGSPDDPVEATDYKAIFKAGYDAALFLKLFP